MKGLNCDSIGFTIYNYYYFFPPALVRSKKIRKSERLSEIISNKMEIKRCAQLKKYQNL